MASNIKILPWIDKYLKNCKTKFTGGGKLFEPSNLETMVFILPFYWHDKYMSFGAEIIQVPFQYASLKCLND